MIAYLSGKVHAKGPGFIVLSTGGVGYRVHVTPPAYAALAVGDPAELYTHQHVREDALELYGFRDMDEIDLFTLLIGISGIGPRSALGVLAIANSEEIRETIASGDPSLLTKVSGIGKKTAERIVLELRDKVGSAPARAEGGVSIGADEIDALIALGYTLQQARDALKAVDPAVTGSGERIRAALKRLGR